MKKHRTLKISEVTVYVSTILLLASSLSCGDDREECDPREGGQQECVDLHRYRECSPDGDPGKSPDYHITITDCRELFDGRRDYCEQTSETSASCREERPDE